MNTLVILPKSFETILPQRPFIDLTKQLVHAPLKTYLGAEETSLDVLLDTRRTLQSCRFVTPRSEADLPVGIHDRPTLLNKQTAI